MLLKTLSSPGQIKKSFQTWLLVKLPPAFASRPFESDISDQGYNCLLQGRDSILNHLLGHPCRKQMTYLSLPEEESICHFYKSFFFFFCTWTGHRQLTFPWCLFPILKSKARSVKWDQPQKRPLAQGRAFVVCSGFWCQRSSQWWDFKGSG